jgi:hypothetical protein
MTVDQLLAAYPYVPGTNAWDYPHGSPERLRGIPPEGGMRETLASLYLAGEKRWAHEELKRRERELGRKAALTQAQSREHADHWSNR